MPQSFLLVFNIDSVNGLKFVTLVHTLLEFDSRILLRISYLYDKQSQRNNSHVELPDQHLNTISIP